MAFNLLETFTDALGSQLVNQASKYLGESESGTKSAVNMLLPALLGGLAKQGSTTEGAAGLLKTLSGSNVDSGLLGNLAGLFSGGSRTDSLVSLGTSLARGLFGDKVGSLVDTVASATGLKSSSSSNLLYMALPLLFGYIKKLVSERNLDASGLMRMLGEQVGLLKGKVDNRVTNALGLGSFLNEPVRAAAETVRRTERYVPPPAQKEPSLLSKLLPWLILGAALLAALPFLRGCGEKIEKAAVVPAPEPARVVAPTPVVALPAKIYFEVASAALSDADKRTIASVAATIKREGYNVDITGYTDRTGDVAKNMELAKQRALAVRDALVAAGASLGQITMKEPLMWDGTTTGTGSDAEARRVEISRSL